MARITSSKAALILKDGTIRGNPITRQQEKFFGAVAGGAKPYSDAKMARMHKLSGQLSKRGGKKA